MKFRIAMKGAPMRVAALTALVLLTGLSHGTAYASEQANGLTLDPPSGWSRSQEGTNVVYRTQTCSLSVLAPRALGGERPVPFFQQTWNSVKGPLRVLREQPPTQMRTGDGSVGRYASAVVDSGADERVVAVFMASDSRDAHFMVFTGEAADCEPHLPSAETAMRSVTLGRRGATPAPL
ncbi:hypothetical protein JL100_017755 [Skermanella mucosa]|uniref:hypothetical protein n=1 Tax=Skermanella mucosa TaxID=1789672 RepID=UPI00192C611D|nr:hypothetical protein [Skermanella mucosa]UEM18935.1 hypothetical protein JL100_017755 [Skermanella mucosa]